MGTEDIIAYYGAQIDKVRRARNPRARAWHHQWIEQLERRLVRQMEWQLVSKDHHHGDQLGS